VIVSLDEAQMRQHALIENIQREQLNIIELAKAYEELIRIHGVTQEELGSLVHKSRSHITNTLRLLQLSDKTQVALIDQRISAGHAKVLVGLSGKEQKIVVDSIHGQKLSVRETEQLVKRMKEGAEHRNVAPDTEKPELNFADAKAQLESMGFAVSAGNNKLSIRFDDQDGIERFLNKLS